MRSQERGPELLQTRPGESAHRKGRPQSLPSARYSRGQTCNLQLEQITLAFKLISFNDYNHNFHNSLNMRPTLLK